MLGKVVTSMRAMWSGRVGLFAAMLMLIATSAFAQIDLTGSWVALQHEDIMERQPGPDAVDYLGLPINEEAADFCY